jgi:putative hemolysin
MTTRVVIEIIIILSLLVANGVFAMTEMAVVSARKAKLKRLSDAGDAGARVALELAESPSRFLPTVQIGITLVGLLAAAFGGITVAEQIAAALKPIPALAPYAEALGLIVVVVALTYLSLIIGELVPKRLALANPEGIACRFARLMDRLSWLARPAIWVLGVSTDGVLRLLRAPPQKADAVSEEEVKLLLQEGMEAGVFHAAEPAMVESVLAFDRRPVRDIMTPREKLVFLNRDDSHETVWHKIVVSGHSNFPVYAASRDRVVGVVSVKAIYANLAAGAGVKLADVMTPPLLVPATQTITGLLEGFKKTRRHIALVADEAHTVVGLVTLVDVLEAIVGEMPSLEERLRPQAVRRDDGSLLVDGGFAVAKLAPLLGESPLAAALGQRSETLAAYVAAQLGSTTNESATFVREGVRFEIIDMDGSRIDKLLVSWEKDLP